MKSEQIKEITEKATDQLVAALNAGHSEALPGYLKAIGCFHRYNLHNAMLIASQRPNASSVAGFRNWNGLGRFVKKGEKGILILAPIVRHKLENQTLRFVLPPQSAIPFPPKGDGIVRSSQGRTRHSDYSQTPES